MQEPDARGQGLHVQLDQSDPVPLKLEFSCPAGEVLALVGPSGSGKSTVLRTIAGLLRNAHGRVNCGGETWLDSSQGLSLSPQRRRVGMVFQQYALFPHLSALANVAEAVPRHHTDRLQRATALLARVNLKGLETRKPHELSGGQQQRVAVARALARDPAVLLLDEPFSAVDELTRRHLHAELAQLRQHLDMPVVLVTHDLDEAALLADHMAVLADGCILQTGTPQEVLQRPASVRVAQLVGMRNLFTADVERHDSGVGTTWLRWDDHLLGAPLAPQYAVGSQVAWTIPSEQVLLPARAGLPDLAGDVGLEVEVMHSAATRQSLQVTLRTVALKSHELVMHTAPANAVRHGVVPGKKIRVRLRGSSIVVMRLD